MDQTIKIPGFISFISSPAGRIARIAAGVAMIGFGYRAKSTPGCVVGVLGLFPLLAGSFDVCLLGPVLGGYFNGSKTRVALHNQNGFPQFGEESKSFLLA